MTVIYLCYVALLAEMHNLQAIHSVKELTPLLIERGHQLVCCLFSAPCACVPSPCSPCARRSWGMRRRTMVRVREPSASSARRRVCVIERLVAIVDVKRHPTTYLASATICRSRTDGACSKTMYRSLGTAVDVVPATVSSVKLTATRASKRAR